MVKKYLQLFHVVNRAVFLAPKVYGFITESNEEIIKVKGLTTETTSNFHINDLEQLLIKDVSKQFSQEKGIKSSNREYYKKRYRLTLKVTSNKRETIYVNGIFNKTKPYIMMKL